MLSGACLPAGLTLLPNCSLLTDSLLSDDLMKKLAALSTACHVRSHSDNFITRFLEGCWINHDHFPPACNVVSIYAKQEYPQDVSRRLSMTHGFEIYPSIADALADALTLGTGQLATDGVLLIAEHGDYPLNEKWQKLYPRYEFM